MVGGNFNLVLMPTLGCNAKCDHCCMASEPKKASLKLLEGEMAQAIGNAFKAGSKSVVFTGGEPTMYMERLLNPMTVAYSLGMYVDLRTNAKWAVSKKRAYEVLATLQMHGLQRLGLSYGLYQKDYVDLECIVNAAKAAEQLGIVVYIDWIGETKLMESALNEFGVDLSKVRMIGNAARLGRAVRLGDSHFDKISIEAIENESEFSHSCGGDGELPSLTILPGGYASFHQCCWINPRLIYKVQNSNGNGNWFNMFIKKANKDVATVFLRDYGIGGLIKKAKTEHPELLRSYYSHQCEACYDLLGVLFPREDVLPRFLQDLQPTCGGGK